MNWILIALFGSVLAFVLFICIGNKTDNQDLLELSAGGIVLSAVVFFFALFISWFPMLDRGQVGKEQVIKVIQTKTKIILESENFPLQETTDFRATTDNVYITKTRFTNAWGGCETFQYRVEFSPAQN